MGSARRKGPARGTPRVVLSRLDRSAAPAWPALRAVLVRILRDHGASGTVSVAIVGDERIRRLHREFLGVDRSTDVITFPLEQPDSPEDGMFGEIVVSAQTALREARRRRLSPGREIALYAIHGALHLVGHDDIDPGDRREMRRAEARYLAIYDAAAPAGPRRAGRGRKRPQRAASIQPPPRRTSPS